MYLSYFKNTMQAFFRHISIVYILLFFSLFSVQHCFRLISCYFENFILIILFVQFSSVTQSCPTLCDPMNRSMPGLPVHHQLLESTQIHVHRVDDAIQPSYPLSSPSPPALNLSQYQGLFQWVSCLYQVAKVLEFQPQISPSNEHPRLIFRMDWLDFLAVQGTLKSLL